MPSPWSSVTVSKPADHRGGGSGSPTRFRLQTASISWSWGAEPASGTLVYVSSAPVTIGSVVRIEIAGHVFDGICKSDTPKTSSKGHTRTLEFADNREFLNWDKVYAAFNLPDDSVVSGQRQKRYKHCLPANFNSRTWTYTTAPYSARQILNFLFAAPTTEDPWERSYHAVQSRPVFDLDFMGGEFLRSAVQKVTDAQGLVFALMGGPFRLVWTLKGEGPAVLIPPESDDRELGVRLSENPTRIRVLGDRNLYQVHDIPMVPDWMLAWQQFFDPILFYERIYQIGKTTAAVTIGTTTFPAGTTFAAIGASPEDPEQLISRQLAKAAALDMTVGQYATLAADDTFRDFRKFSGRARTDMPAVLYIEQILFRAFRFQDGFGIKNAYGNIIPLHSLEIVPKLVAGVTHDPITGQMAWNPDENSDGTGYGIVKGYQVGKDLFRTLRPDRFDLTKWTDAQDVWEHIEFQVDDSGSEDRRYILFDEPIIRSSDLVVMKDGYAVFRANPDFSNPPLVRIAVTFQAEQFSFIKGVGTRDDSESVPSLCGEFVGTHGAIPDEIPFADGLTATEKAETIADSLLARQYFYQFGSFVRWIKRNPDGSFPPPTQLMGKIDRVEMQMSAQGVREQVYLTSELPRQFFVPERDLDRAAKFRALLPGQAELKHQSNIARLTAAALRQSPSARKTVGDAFQGMFGNTALITTAVLAPGVATALPAGSIIRKKPHVIVNEVATNTQGVLPLVAGAAYSQFVGVTMRDGETVADTGGELRVATSGEILALVKGPVKAGDVVGLVDNANHLAATGSQSVGKALQSIADTSTKLILVRTSSASAAGDESFPFQIVKGQTGDNTVKVVLNSFLLKGLDTDDKQRIFGLDTEFTVAKTDVVFLEMLFDKTGKIFLANIARGTWDSESFPKSTRAVRKTVDNSRINESSANWALPNSDPDWSTNKTLSEMKFNEFDGVRRHFKSWIAIGFCVPGTIASDGLSMSDSGGQFAVVQSLKTNLVLAGFCENGVPVSYPIAANMPVIARLPDVTANQVTFGTQLSVPGFPAAVIRYTLDGTDPDQTSAIYAGAIPGQVQDTYIKAFASLEGYFDSTIGTFQGWL